MNIKLASVVIISCLALSSCATSQEKPPYRSGADTSLAEASYSVSRSISSLSEIAQASRPLPTLESPPNPASYGMGELTSVDWSGPVEPLLRQLANAANYRLRVLGNKPAIPLLVSVYDKNMMLADIVRDVGYQCGRRANVIVFPDSRVIELRYAKN